VGSYILMIQLRFIRYGVILGLVLAVALTTLGFGSPSTANAQGEDVCPKIVLDAFKQTQAQCARTGLNKTCYGNVSARADLIPGVTGRFEKPGDVVDVSAIRSLALAPMNTETKTWGVALMRLKAETADTADSEAVTMIVFGSVRLVDARTIPTANIPGNFQPMHAFYIKSSGGTPCKGAPKEGVLIQTPKGRKKVEFWVNGSTLKLGSTTFIETLKDGELSFNILEGTGEVTAGGSTTYALPGERIWVPMSNGLTPRGPAREPQPYNPAAVNTNLPLDLLPRPIEIVPPLPNVPSEGRQFEIEDGLLLDGTLEAITPGNPTSITIAGETVVVRDPQLLAGVAVGEPIRVLAQTEDGAYVARAITSLLPADQRKNNPIRPQAPQEIIPPSPDLTRINRR